ncbi:MAG: GTP cyclohydrolase I FolE [Bacteroidetes bacterium]|nr:GTP cyclohydrolase I FolE [Rhodothermia bacterium]MCS7154893.1 GTP cyclohydrolase I FolE [Bacteroidota bacterium]MCX7906948.1 GTP cyclohydrolase I FolE [Bacteroidota bacterium]MDW8137688.1 GTP cyclohydrolase I FolE [Bacteroidota bacterium]MDW8285358.1 GTP cyclohydrolase I FolE [Bacteroidota bacterium]
MKPEASRYATDNGRYEAPSPSRSEELAQLLEAAIRLLGEDPTREGLRKTPHRAARALEFLTQGYRQDPRAVLREALFEEPYNEMVIVRDIELFSLCEHHLLPFFGKAHVAYVPNGKVVGLSKIPRVVDIFARRLQLQERLTTQIRDVLQEVLQPLGVAVVIEARHLCMAMRGVQKQHSLTVTSAVSGVFEQEATRAEFMRLIRNGFH